MTFHNWTTSTLVFSPMRKTQLAFGGTKITACYSISPKQQHSSDICFDSIATCCSISAKTQHSLNLHLALKWIYLVAVCAKGKRYHSTRMGDHEIHMLYKLLRGREEGGGAHSWPCVVQLKFVLLFSTIKKRKGFGWHTTMFVDILKPGQGFLLQHSRQTQCLLFCQLETRKEDACPCRKH